MLLFHEHHSEIILHYIFQELEILIQFPVSHTDRLKKSTKENM